MDEILVWLIIGMLAVLTTAVFAWTKRKGIDKKVEETYLEYKFLFDAFGMVLKSIDEKLYEELSEAIETLTVAYNSETVSAKQFAQMVKEFDDVYKRAKELIDNRKKD